MGKERDIQYVCSQCGHVEKKWLGRCPECGSWNTFEEEAVKPQVDTTKVAVMSSGSAPVALCEVQVDLR